MSRPKKPRLMRNGYDWELPANVRPFQVVLARRKKSPIRKVVARGFKGQETAVRKARKTANALKRRQRDGRKRLKVYVLHRFYADFLLWVPAYP